MVFLGERGVTRTLFAIGLAAGALGVMPAVAADLGRLSPPAPFYPPPAVARVYNWTGCYLGAQLGGAFGNNTLNGPFAGFQVVDQGVDSAGVLAGGQVGCDLQFAPNWVIGAQIDGAWTNLRGSVTLTGANAIANATGNLGLKADAIATGTGRIGYAANFDSIAGLFYLKGGAAFVENDTSNFLGQLTITAVNPPVSGVVNFSAPESNRWGWTIGLGTEWVVMGNWSVFGEWDYLNFGTQNVTFTDPIFGSNQFSFKQNINELKLGINYRFGNPLPGYP
jgi:outer membrane immunogenic protein